MGAAVASGLVSGGAAVVITDVQAAAGKMLATEFACEFISQELTDEERWPAMFQCVEKRCGGALVLINNAGIECPFDLSNPENPPLV